MGLFNFFKKDVFIEDKVFGLLKYIEGNNTCFFSGKQIFTPLEKEVEINIITTTDKPTVEQQNFYLELQINYNDYKLKMSPIIEDIFNEAFDNFKIKDFNKEFNLKQVTIPNFHEKILVWNLSFESIHEKNHLFTVDFNNYEAIDLQIDG